jgi:hypothetical protein
MQILLRTKNVYEVKGVRWFQYFYKTWILLESSWVFLSLVRENDAHIEVVCYDSQLQRTFMIEDS